MKRLPPRVATLLAACLLAASVAVTPAAGHPRDRQYDNMDPPQDYMGEPDIPNGGPQGVTYEDEFILIFNGRVLIVRIEELPSTSLRTVLRTILNWKFVREP